jgi:penicillin-binding protein 1A
MAKAKKKKRKKKRHWALRVFLWLFALGMMGGAAGVGGLVGLFYYYGSDPDLPRISSIQKPKALTRILDRNGLLIGEIASERRTVIPFEQIPKVLIQAVTSAEDAAFFKHRGLDYTGMLRAFIANLRAGRFAQGGSTITQQVVKTVFLSPRRTIRRKMQEVILAWRLESELSKNEILTLYLNRIYFGHGRYGVQEASRYFFGKDAIKLNAPEAAMIAGLPQSPARLSPLKHPKRAKRRQRYVLGEMARHGHLKPAEADHLSKVPIRVVRHRRPYYNAAPEITDIVRAQLVKKFGAGKLGTLGLTVRTSVDVKLQVAAREALQWGLRAIDARHGYREGKKPLSKKRLARALKRLKRNQKRTVEGTHYQGIVLSVDDAKEMIKVDIGLEKVNVHVDSQRYNPQKHVASKRFKAGAKVRVRAGRRAFYFDGGPQGVLVAMEPKTGDVIAMVGGYDFSPGQYNRARRSRRQPGSAFKPFVYGAAIASGRYTPATIVDDSPVVYKGWQPRNFTGSYRGPIRLRVALAHSINSVAAKLIYDVGVDKVRALAQSLGIKSPLGNDLSIALGSSAVTPLELANAYSGIANGGRRVEPRFILSIEGGEGAALADAKSQPNKTVAKKAKTKTKTKLVAKETADTQDATPPADDDQAMKPAVAYVLTSMMSSVVKAGTARRARQLRRPLVGKTGTTNQQKDAWFAGFSPELVAVVWTGFDTPRTLGRRESGGRASLPVWIRFMRKALHKKPRRPFAQPPGVVVERIDPESGLLAVPGATDAMDEVFVAGTQPTEQVKAPDEVNPDTLLMNPSIP